MDDKTILLRCQFFLTWATVSAQSRSKFQKAVFGDTDKSNLKFIWRGKTHKTASTIMKKNRAEGFTLWSFKTYHKFTVTKSVRPWQKNERMKQGKAGGSQNKLENHIIITNSSLERGKGNSMEKRQVLFVCLFLLFSINCSGKLDIHKKKKIKYKPEPYTFHKKITQNRS